MVNSSINNMPYFNNYTINLIGFMLFMIDMRPRLEADGHRFPAGLMDVHPVATPLWNV